MAFAHFPLSRQGDPLRFDAAELTYCAFSSFLAMVSKDVLRFAEGSVEVLVERMRGDCVHLDQESSVTVINNYGDVIWAR